MARRLPVSLFTLVLAMGWLVVLAVPANAACHIAGFVESEVEVQESAGVVSVVVELQGRVGSCAGTVDVATVDGTAVAGEDYEAVSRTLTFEANDDRVETVDVTILADDAADGGETFTVELSNPTGDITNTSDPATVMITEDGAQMDDNPPDEEEPTASATDEDDTADEPATAEDEDDGGGDLGIIIAVIAAIAIGGGAFVVLRGRG